MILFPNSEFSKFSISLLNSFSTFVISVESFKIAVKKSFRELYPLSIV